jgi:hypothetical protein
MRIFVYVAGSFDNRHVVSWVIEALVRSGCSCTFDWPALPVPGADELDVLRSTAWAERDAVRRADAVIVLLPAGQGTHVALGIAIGQRTPVVLVGAPDAFKLPERVHECPFYLLPNVRRVLLDKPLDAASDYDALVKQIEEALTYWWLPGARS